MNIDWNQNEFYFGEDDFASAMEQTVAPWRKDFLKEGFLHSYDNTKLHYLYACHPSERAAIVLSHGFCEFAGKYHEVMYYFYQAGYSVFLMEHRGHGYSERAVPELDKVYVESYDEYVRDLKCFVDEVVIPKSAGGSRFLFAHSMGGAIGALFLEEYPDVFSAAVLSSPLLEMTYGSVPDWAVKILMVWSSLAGWKENYVPGQHGFDNIYKYETSSCMSEPRYAYAFRQRQETPEYTTYGGTYAWSKATIRAMKRVQKQAAAIQIPVLLFQAGADSMVRPAGQERFAKACGHTRLVSFPGAKHELFNMLWEDRISYYRQIFAFLEEPD